MKSKLEVRLRGRRSCDTQPTKKLKQNTQTNYGQQRNNSQEVCAISLKNCSGNNSENLFALGNTTQNSNENSPNEDSDYFLSLFDKNTDNSQYSDVQSSSLAESQESDDVTQKANSILCSLRTTVQEVEDTPDDQSVDILPSRNKISCSNEKNSTKNEQNSSQKNKRTNAARQEKIDEILNMSQLIDGKLTYCPESDYESPFDARKEEKNDNCKARALELKNQFLTFDENEIRCGKRDSERILRGFKNDWQILFEGENQSQTTGISDFISPKPSQNIKIVETDQIKHENLYVYLDIDAFYASVETILRPCDYPMAVGNLQMLAACNYQSRKYGVKAGMPGYHAKARCPQLEIREPNFEMYNLFSDRVMQILALFDPTIGVFGMDECCMVFNREKMIKAFEYLCNYENGEFCLLKELQEQTQPKEKKKRKTTLNFSQKLKKTEKKSTLELICSQTVDKVIQKKRNSLLRADSSEDDSNQNFVPRNEKILSQNTDLLGYSALHDRNTCSLKISKLKFTQKNLSILIEKIRNFVHVQTGLTMSSGVSVSRGIAKLCTSVNKPNGQFFLLSNVQNYIRPLPLNKINGIGSQTKILMNKLDIFTVQDLQKNLYKIFLLFKPKSFYNILRMAHGLSIFDNLNERINTNVPFRKISYDSNFHHPNHNQRIFNSNINSITKNSTSYDQSLYRAIFSKSKTFKDSADPKNILFYLWSLCKSLCNQIQHRNSKNSLDEDFDNSQENNSQKKCPQKNSPNFQSNLVTITVKTAQFKTVTKQRKCRVRNDVEVFNLCSTLLHEVMETFCREKGKCMLCQPNLDKNGSSTDSSNLPTSSSTHLVDLRLLGVTLSNFVAPNKHFINNQIVTEVFQCFICKTIFKNVNYKFFNGHVNLCADKLQEEEQKAPTSISNPLPPAMSEIMSSPESNSNENQNCNKKRKSNDQSTKEAQKNIPKVSKSVKSLSPIKFLKTTKRVKVTLKWNLFYVGDLCEFDKYFNLVLINADEWVDNKFTGRIDQICIRCNNVKIIEEI